MNKIKNTIRSLTPDAFLSFVRKYKKDLRRKRITAQLEAGLGMTQAHLVNQLKNLGVQHGKDVLVHCSFGNLGAIQNGPESLIEALIECVGDEAHVLMPSSPISGYQLEYAQSNPVFDVENSPSKLGVLSEVFRRKKGVVRSAHPLEPVCVLGKHAIDYTLNHHIDDTAYGMNSPFRILADRGGQILYLGVSLDNAGTSLHVSEDAIKDFKFPVYYPSSFDLKIIKEGKEEICTTKVHDPAYSVKRRCDELLPMFVQHRAAHNGRIGEATSWWFDAKKMQEVLQAEYHKNGVTMYTPKGIL